MIQRMLCVGIWILGVSAAAAVLNAQGFEMAGGFLVGVPTGEFSQSVDTTGLGFSMRVTFPLGDGPIRIGGELGYLRYGSQRWSEQLLESVPDVIVNVHTTNNILLGHFLVRLEPRSGTVRPYVEGLIGGAYLFTDTSLEDAESGEAFASTKNLHDGVFSYGIGGGAQIVLWDGMRRAVGQVPIQFLLEGRVRYLRGSEGRYLKEGSIRREDGQVTYDVLESRTDMFLPEISLAMRF